MNYVNRCGDCKNYELLSSNAYEKGYCEWYGVYCYPDEYAGNCSHYDSRTNVGSSCYITTIVCHVLGLKDDCDVLNTLRTFRDTVLQKNDQYAPILMEYDTIGPRIAELIQEEYGEDRDKTVCQNMYEKFLVPTVLMIRGGQYDAAIEKYRDMIFLLKDYYAISTSSIEYLIEDYDSSQGGHGRVHRIKGESR